MGSGIGAGRAYNAWMAKAAGETSRRILSPSGVTWAGLAVNGVLMALKMVVGTVCASQTLLADGLHTASDLVTDVAVLAGLRMSSQPADEAHRYGHRRISTMVALLVGAALLAAAGWIAYRAVSALRVGAGPVRGSLPLWVALASVPMKEALYQVTRLVGRRAGDLSLLANAWHHRSDAVSSIAASAGLAGALFGGPAWAFLDPLTAIALSAFLLTAAGKIIVQSASELVDRAPGAGTLAGIEHAVAGTRNVRGFHAFRARRVGGKVEMDIHVQVDPDLTVREGHDIATAVKDQVRRADEDVVEVIVHIEPAEDDGRPTGPARR